MELPRTRQALERAEDGLVRLRAAEQDAQEFYFLVPYVLDLLAAVTRMIDEETRGQRTQDFAAWWHTVDRRMSDQIKNVRHAELKRQERRTTRRVGITITEAAIFSDEVDGVVLGPDGELHAVTGSPANHTYVDSHAHDRTAEWVFRKEGELDGLPVLDVLDGYLRSLAEDIVPRAQRLMTR